MPTGTRDHFQYVGWPWSGAHGAKDDLVPPDDDRLLIQAFRAAGARDARHTEFPDANHNSWDPAYSQTPALWTWLFAQRKASR